MGGWWRRLFRPEPMDDAEIVAWLIVGVLWMVALSFIMAPPADVAAPPPM